MCRWSGKLVGTRPVYHTSVQVSAVTVLCFHGYDLKILLWFFVVGVSCSDQGRTVYNVELLKQPQDCSGIQNHGDLNNFCFYCPNLVLQPRKKLLEYSERNCVYRNGGVCKLRHHKTFSIYSGKCFWIFSIEFYSRPSYLLSFKHTALRCVASRQNNIAFASKMAYILSLEQQPPPAQ
jgi:hypothetical protein